MMKQWGNSRIPWTVSDVIQATFMIRHKMGMSEIQNWIIIHV